MAGEMSPETRYGREYRGKERSDGYTKEKK